MATYLPDQNVMVVDGRAYWLPDKLAVHNAKRIRYDDHQQLLIKPRGFIGYVPVICTKIYKKGKTVYCDLQDYKGTFRLIQKGFIKIGYEWIEFDEDFEKGSAYLLKLECFPEYPIGLKLLGKKKLN